MERIKNESLEEGEGVIARLVQANRELIVKGREAWHAAVHGSTEGWT